MIKKIRFFSIYLLVIALLLIPFGCAKLKTVNKTIFAFNTTISISFSYDDSKIDEDVLEIITDTFYSYSRLSDYFTEYDNLPNLYTINHSQDFVEVDEKLVGLILTSLELKEETGGYFNPLIGNISMMYKNMLAKLSPTIDDVPSSEDIARELEIMNNSIVVIVGNKVKITGGATLDLGAIAKGYALEEVKKILESYEIKFYLISAGSSSIALGEKDTSEYYRVGLRYVDDVILQIKNKSLGTSSINEQQVVIDDVLYHHIINPFTGKCETNFDTIYVIGDDNSKIDGYITAFMSMNQEKILEICDELSWYIMIYKNNTLLYSSQESYIYD